VPFGPVNIQLAFVVTRVVTPWNVSAFKFLIEEFMAPGAMYIRTAPILGDSGSYDQSFHREEGSLAASWGF